MTDFDAERHTAKEFAEMQQVFDEEDFLKMVKQCKSIGYGRKISDGFHTLEELYEHRTVLLAVVVNLLPSCFFKSRKHEDGSMFPGYFIVMGTLCSGQISYHCEERYWDLFKCGETEFAAKWDGHSSDDVLDRITRYVQGQ